MANKMLIDAAHPEETRVVVVKGNRVEEFDFESANRKQLRGNIYLAKVTRVEPSLQAAFVEYGGNRHGFLAFSEIHPDYYQIPQADRQALLEEEENDEKSSAASEDDLSEDKNADAQTDTETATGDDAEAAKETDQPSVASEEDDKDEDDVEQVGAEDAMEEVPERRRRGRQYKIQEVIKRRQVLLVQVVKEERGNKGAALTTYLSLAGRYSVLMPNTARGGGISRKITNPTDRKRLKKIASELDVPEGMGVILRTAGASRTKAEIKRDFEYLLRLWENVRQLTLMSSAPLLVYEEGSLIKRSIRDLYNKDIDEVLVAGDEGYKEAKSFMRMLMPSHAKNVQPYKDQQPIFTRFAIEGQLDAMFSPQVTLRSGGYIVINQTEALVSVDVNSGKATREHNIEDTALQTNLEAAEEMSRQLRLRDMAGLIVIDFIDMEEKRNNRAVERKLKDCLKSDRARIQVGRISHFGLLEMSRQRIRSGVLEGSTEVCPHCAGAGIVRSTESLALHVLRSLEDTLLKGVKHNLIVTTKTAVALYILNQKRSHLIEIEQRFGLVVEIRADDAHLPNGQHYLLERGEPIDVNTATMVTTSAVTIDQPDVPDITETFEEQEEESVSKKRRRRRRKRRSSVDAAETTAAETADADDEDGAEARDAAADDASSDDDDNQQPRKRRRGRRGGRRNRRRNAQTEDNAETLEADGETDSEETGEAVTADAEADNAETGSGDAPQAEERPVSAEAEVDGNVADTDGTEAVAEGASVKTETDEDASAKDDETHLAEAASERETADAVRDENDATGSVEPIASDATEADPSAETDVEASEAVSSGTSEDEAEAETSVAPVDADPATAADAPDEGAETHAETESEDTVEETSLPAETAEHAVVADAEPAAQPVAEEPVEEEPREKRSGWWQRRSFF